MKQFLNCAAEIFNNDGYRIVSELFMNAAKQNEITMIIVALVCNFNSLHFINHDVYIVYVYECSYSELCLYYIIDFSQFSNI